VAMAVGVGRWHGSGCWSRRWHGVGGQCRCKVGVATGVGVGVGVDVCPPACRTNTQSSEPSLWAAGDVNCSSGIRQNVPIEVNVPVVGSYHRAVVEPLILSGQAVSVVACGK